jgi:hypothetical protein
LESDDARVGALQQEFGVLHHGIAVLGPHRPVIRPHVAPHEVVGVEARDFVGLDTGDARIISDQLARGRERWRAAAAKATAPTTGSAGTARAACAEAPAPGAAATGAASAETASETTASGAASTRAGNTSSAARAHATAAARCHAPPRDRHAGKATGSGIVIEVGTGVRLGIIDQ